MLLSLVLSVNTAAALERNTHLTIKVSSVAGDDLSLIHISEPTRPY